MNAVQFLMRSLGVGILGALTGWWMFMIAWANSDPTQSLGPALIMGSIFCGVPIVLVIRMLMESIATDFPRDIGRWRAIQIVFSIQALICVFWLVVLFARP